MSSRKRGSSVIYDRTGGNQYLQIPVAVTSCANYRKLTYQGKALLMDAGTLFTGKNNGDISLAYKIMHPLGWSNGVLIRARQELEYYRFINISRQGGRNMPTLYSLAWININYCGGKLQVQPTSEPARTYLEDLLKLERKKRPTMQSETIRLLTTGEIPEHVINPRRYKSAVEN